LPFPTIGLRWLRWLRWLRLLRRARNERRRDQGRRGARGGHLAHVPADERVVFGDAALALLVHLVHLPRWPCGHSGDLFIFGEPWKKKAAGNRDARTVLGV
jgi:hypothetical protein